MEALSTETLEHLERIGTATLVVGIATFNNRETVGRVAEAGLQALMRGLASRPAMIVNADGASKDGTPELLREIAGDKVPLVQVRYPLYPARRLAAPLVGVPGRQEAALTIFNVARRTGAACILLDAALESASSEWVDRLAAPVLEQKADLVVPCYSRHKFEGLINGGLVTPLMRALYGKRLRQPSGADLAFSARLVAFYADRSTEDSEAAPVDPWNTDAAVMEGFQLGQTSLGPRQVRTREVSDNLSDTLSQILQLVFRRMESSALYWQKVRGSEPVPWFGPPLELDSGPADLNPKRLADSFRLGCQDLAEIYSLVLPPATLLEFRKMTRLPEGQFRFRDGTWARTVYDFALAYHLRVIGRDHLLKALTPLYSGWAGSFVGEMQDAGAEQIEARLEQLALRFEAEKRYLISRWRWPDRFNP